MILLGVDPGIVDTAAVKISLDMDARKWSVQTRVWHNVTARLGQNNIEVDPHFVMGLSEFAFVDPAVQVFIEGYRQRGRDTKQDARMLKLVDEIKRSIRSSEIVDNAGIKKIVTEPMLKLFNVSRFEYTNHSDLKSAARVALAGGIKRPILNYNLAMFVRDNLRGQSWQYVSTSTL